jgi:hypothetical protein
LGGLREGLAGAKPPQAVGVINSIPCYASNSAVQCSAVQCMLDLLSNSNQCKFGSNLDYAPYWLSWGRWLTQPVSILKGIHTNTDTRYKHTDILNSMSSMNMIIRN